MAALTAYLGLGSNEGDRLANLRAAVELLSSARGVEVLARSSVYETEPQGGATGQRDFYNAVVKVAARLEPRRLLEACKAVEHELGRRAGGPRHGPRPIDLDILLVDELELAEEGLSVPHPEVTARRFVLAPLLELDPELALPGGGGALADALEALAGAQRVTRVAAL